MLPTIWVKPHNPLASCDFDRVFWFDFPRSPQKCSWPPKLNHFKEEKLRMEGFRLAILWRTGSGFRREPKIKKLRMEGFRLAILWRAENIQEKLMTRYFMPSHATGKRDWHTLQAEAIGGSKPKRVQLAHVGSKPIGMLSLGGVRPPTTFSTGKTLFIRHVVDQTILLFECAYFCS